MKNEFSEMFEMMKRARKSVISSYRTFAKEIGMSSTTIFLIEGGARQQVTAY